ncbi:MAG TPA: exodeoxyribonuclease VII large subunit [Candidatus Limnocylindria bacterium]|jgi:exodeoxyribonuclease VII large subunit|nr:exodeoxyribonuclease VII large subunit [Candidatus Limnocylindria bacterium]
MTGPSSGTPLPSTGPRVWRVSDLNRRVRGLLDADQALADIWVEGEVSGPSFPPSGHCFFTLKDAHSQIKAVLFREELARASVRPEHGAQLVCHGRVRAYEPQGVYQLYVESVTPVGAGDLHAQYEALRAKLAAEGLFDESRKRPLPRWPRRIGVVTSPVGAVWDDICTVLRRRYPMAEVVLSPTAVQGGVAAPAIIRALKRLYAVGDLDLVILARGGGSIEDLWGFNDEHVVRAVVASPVPVVVGVGHESDITLADFAADRRAPTPSAAAEIAVPDGTQLPAILNRLGERAAGAMSARLEAGRRAVRGEGRALTGLQPDLATARQRAAELLDRSHRAASADVERRRLAVTGLRDALRALGPAATLERGYAVARRADGMIIRDPADVAAGDDLEVVVARGIIGSRVTTATPGDMEDLLS